ncbi:MAG TPA: molybdenum cofactor guanylyltransferase [Gammaproteobacteria bacterium]|nr:molybdenum cofactor guanylyltransferase [Gammaproteobacteria bacterium]
MNTTDRAGPAARQITAVILAGGRGRRMGGRDKGLVSFAGRPLVEHVLEAVRPQCGQILISANRNLPDYRRYGFPVLEDSVGDYSGPLAGVATALEVAQTPFLLTLPCDSPFPPTRLATVLLQRLLETEADAAVAHDGHRLQPMFALLRRELLSDLLAYLGGGGRGAGEWYRKQRLAVADFGHCAAAFGNINTETDKEELERRPG